MNAERITIEGRFDCRTPDGDPLTVLQWRRQVADGGHGAPARWRSVGPAVFTLYDASAVIQVSGSALLVVATGMMLDVVRSRESVDSDATNVWSGRAARPTQDVNAMAA
ncbi:MAG TPA: hypothetical protein VI032_17105 [Burkholderiaceae bacterium]